MTDELNPNVDPEIPEVPVVPAEEPIPPDWGGRMQQVRTEAAQEVANTRAVIDAQLSQYGRRMDWTTNQIVEANPGYVQPQQPYYPPQQPVEEEYIDLTDPAVFREKVTQMASQIAAQQLGQIMPLLNNLTEGAVSQQYNDWADIGGEVQQRLEQYGMSMAQAKAVAPQLLEDVIYATRARRQAVVPPTPVPLPGVNPQLIAQETIRQAAIAAAGGVGGVPSTTPAPSASGLTAEEHQDAVNMGITDERYIALSDGPATIERKK